MIGQPTIYLPSVDSTNDYLMALAQDPTVPEGTVVRAGFQTAGKGQMGTRWVAEPDVNLMMSVLLRPVWLRVLDQWQLSVAVAVAVHDALVAALEGCFFDVEMLRLKWPNDLWLGSRKLGGILIQNTLDGTRLNTSIVGIGLNINQLRFPPEANNATSLALATGQTHDLERLLPLFFEALQRRYTQLQMGGWPAIQSAYYERLLGYGAIRTFQRTKDDVRFDATIVGVTPEGYLMLRDAAGVVHNFELKEIRLI
jgi:BirA family transcriptional regulator, biotin operon repressor / biotin---[acetyl-CoA-carboxylase] ligase